VSAYDKDRDGREGYFSLEHCSVFNERPIDLVHVQTNISGVWMAH
jgi:YHS domain-containing protein